jgi:bifunctional non-homologous end joining protein LigD
MNRLPVIEPVIVKRKQIPFDGLEWIFELKFDGHRAILYYEDGVCILKTKTGARHPFPKLEAELAKALSKNQSVILDGEIVAFDEKHRQSLELLQRHQGIIGFVAFDIMWLNGRDLRGKPLEYRKPILRKVIYQSIALCDGCIGEGIRFYKSICRSNLEGMVAKLRTGTYDSKRAGWYKVKNPNYSGEETRRRLYREVNRKK